MTSLSHKGADDAPGAREASFAASNYEDGKFHLLLAASGSVATIKIPDIIKGLANVSQLSIRVLFTASAARFASGESPDQVSLERLRNLPNVDGVYLDEDEWKEPWTRNSPILHIELRRWASLLVIAPLSANTLAKLSNGLCDNLLTSVVRAWEVLSELDAEPTSAQKQILVAPAMNTAMWRHPLTAKHLQQLSNWHWYTVLWPVDKQLACGDTGAGAMHEWKDIVENIRSRIA